MNTQNHHSQRAIASNFEARFVHVCASSEDPTEASADKSKGLITGANTIKHFCVHQVGPGHYNLNFAQVEAQDFILHACYMQMETALGCWKHLVSHQWFVVGCATGL
eukprot:2580626-Amphidinium_carterae.3